MGKRLTLTDHESDEDLEGIWIISSVGGRELEKVAKERAHGWTKYRDSVDV